MNLMSDKSCFVCKHVPIWMNFYCGLKGKCKESKREVLYDMYTNNFFKKNDCTNELDYCGKFENNIIERLVK